MSSNLIKTAQETLLGSDLEKTLNRNQKKWRNTWSFRFHSKIPFYNHEEPFGKNHAKKLIQKYYGRKILYVTKPTEANSMISRSKLLESMSISENSIMKRSLRSKGDLVILDADLRYLDHLFEFSDSFGQWDQWNLRNYKPLKKDIQYLHFKKIIKYCQRADVAILVQVHPCFLKYMSDLKHLSLKSSTNHDLESVGNIIVNLGHLESLKFTCSELKEFLTPFRRTNQEVKPKEKRDKKFFSKLHELNHLKKMTFVADSKIIQHHFEEMEQDLQTFYSKPLKFHLHLKILLKNIPENLRDSEDYKEEISSVLKLMLNNAEYLALNADEDESKVREEMQRIKAGKNNIIDMTTGRVVKIKTILSSCNSLQALYISPYSIDFNWKIDPQSDEVFARLQNVILNFRSLNVQCQLSSDSNPEQYTIPHLKCNLNKQKPEEQSILSTLIWTILYELKQKCHSLQDCSLFLSISHLKQRDDRERRILGALDDEISKFDKLKLFHLRPDKTSFSLLASSKILTNDNLETLNIDFNQNQDSSFSGSQKDSPTWDQCFAVDTRNHLKRLSVNISRYMKIPLCGPSLLVNLPKLEHLQAIELFDYSDQVMTFDFLYRLLIQLLEKKTMRKILIRTKVTNGFYSSAEDLSQNTGTFFSQSLNNHLEKMLKEVHEDLETRVERLKGFELEEVLVGKWEGYSFDYMLYNKEMKIVDKIFWNGKELEGLFYKKKVLRDLYNHIFDLYRTGDPFMKASPGRLFDDKSLIGGRLIRRPGGVF